MIDDPVLQITQIAFVSAVTVFIENNSAVEMDVDVSVHLLLQCVNHLTIVDCVIDIDDS